ncbi:MAG TPA: hypothetical protein VII34_04120, partial [Pyrinomonadaceae bacterium]
MVSIDRHARIRGCVYSSLSLKLKCVVRDERIAIQDNRESDRDNDEKSKIGHRKIGVKIHSSCRL